MKTAKISYRPAVFAARQKPGVLYAAAPDGLRLPVIDIGNPAFRFEPAALDAAARPEAHKPPSFLRALLMKPLLRKSALAQIVLSARGTYARGLGTYILKLGPDNLGEAFASPMDRAIASSLPCLSARHSVG